MTIRHLMFAALLGTVAPSMASAGPIWTINTDAKGGVNHLETVTFTFNGHVETGLAGTLTTKQVSGGPSFDTYCIDLYHNFHVGNGGSTWDAEVLPISSFKGDTGVPQGDALGGNAGAIGYLYNKYAANVTTDIQGAALQIAIWKVDYDNSANLATGSFRFAPTSNDPNSVQSQVYEQAKAYLAGFDGTQSSGNASFLRALSHPNGTRQDFVGPASIAVPEPASVALVLSGMGVVLVARRRMNRVA